MTGWMQWVKPVSFHFPNLFFEPFGKHIFSSPARVAKVTGQPPINCEYEQHAVSNWWKKTVKVQSLTAQSVLQFCVSTHTHTDWTQSYTPLLLTQLAAFPDFLLLFPPWALRILNTRMRASTNRLWTALWLSPWLFTLSTNYHMLVHHPPCFLSISLFLPPSSSMG